MARTVLQDLRFATRLLLKDRTFAVTAILTLAICIGANTAIFSIVRSVLLRPLPVPDAGRIVALFNAYPNAGAPRASTGVPDYFDRLRELPALDQQALYRRQGMTLGGGGNVDRVSAVRATPSFFRLLGATPVHGRLFSEADGEIGQEYKVLLGYGLWQREFGGAPDAVGKPLRLNGRAYDIVGVLPADFKFLWNDIELWVPAAFTPEQKSDDSRHSNNWQMIGRLSTGQTVEEAQRQLDALNARNDERFPQFRQILKDAGFHTTVINLQDDVVREIRPVLYLLWGGVAFVLLIGCVNIANLVLTRATGRTREFATRFAIGADPARMRRQILTESSLVALVGGVLGLLLGSWALKSVGWLGLEGLPRGFEIAIDPVTVAVILALSLVVGLFIGMLPVLRLSRIDLNAAMREEGRSGTSGRGTNLLRRGLATAQVAIAFVLLIGAGLLLASFRAVLQTDLGFDPRGVVSAAISLPQVRYSDAAQIAAFSDRLTEAVRTLPGVEAAGVTDVLPLSGDSNDSVILAEGYVMKPGESLVSPTVSAVSPGYFEAMRIPLARGRYFDERDTSAATLVALVDERLARKFWPGQDPIGRRIYRPDGPNDVLAAGPDTKYITVVGVVKEVQVHGAGLDREPVGAYYFPMSQSPSSAMALVVRTAGDPEVLTPSLRSALSGLDPELPLYNVRTMEARVDESLLSRRVPMFLAMVFASVALLLAAVGIYGVLAYGVSQRQREIGIRMALGSTSRHVFGLVLSEGAKIIGAGLVLGLAGTALLAQAIGSLLYGVRPMEPVVIAAVAAALVLIALVAVLIPARRAARVSPLTALT